MKFIKMVDYNIYCLKVSDG